ncbi:MAG: 16S rRNA (guanine(527)-N(7))-methyltransferase RsmG [Bacillales bacterium]
MINEYINAKNKLNEYMNLVIEKNKVMNLTSITDENEFIDKHFYDSVIPSLAIDFNDKKVLDIGSGAGFPGIPLAILYPNAHFTLIETLKKRTIFLEEVIKKLELNNVAILNKRAEDIKNDERESFDIVMSRAVSSLPILIEFSTPYIKKDGFLLSYKGIKYKDELDLSKNALKVMHLNLITTQDKILPISKENRYNLIFKKTAETRKKFPRNFSQIKKRPL